MVSVAVHNRNDPDHPQTYIGQVSENEFLCIEGFNLGVKFQNSVKSLLLLWRRLLFFLISRNFSFVNLYGFLSQKSLCQ